MSLMENAPLKKSPNMLKRVKVWRIKVLATLALGPRPARFYYRVTRLSEQFSDRRVGGLPRRTRMRRIRSEDQRENGGENPPAIEQQRIKVINCWPTFTEI